MILSARRLLLALTFGALLVVSTSAKAQEGPASDLLKQLFPQVHDAIWDIPTLENGAKQALVAVFSTMIEMSAPEVGGSAVEGAFGISLQKVLADVVADPAAAAELAAGKFGEGLAEDAAVSVAAALLTDYLMARPPFADLPQDYRIILGAAFRAILEEGYSLFKATSNPAAAPEVVLSGLIDRALDVYAIAVESKAVADIQRSAFIASAQSIESAAVLAQLKTARSGEVALATVRQAQDILAEMVGKDDAEAVREIVNLAFIALLSQQRGDTERALSFANRMLAFADKADNIGPFSAILRPVDWLVAINREDYRDAPSEAAFTMVSTTSLRFLFRPDGGPGVAPGAGEPAMEAPSPPEESAPPDSAGVWNDGIVFASDLGYRPCQDRAGDPSCLRGMGLNDQAAAFSHALMGDYSGSGRAIKFRELGPVDLGVGEVIGANSWYVPVLLNGTPDFQPVEGSLDLFAAFRDETSRSMLTRFPGAMSRDLIIRAHRTLQDGTQRFVLVEILADQCRACDLIGTAVSFIDIGPSTNGRVVRRPIGLWLTGAVSMDAISARDLVQRPDVLQETLNGLGYEAGQMDGYPGPGTRIALMEFQVEHCLVPTGEPDPETTSALVSASGFDAPCKGARLPAGITANSPLRTGIYVDDPGLCNLASVPMEIIFQSQITVSEGGWVMWGYEDGCVTDRTDIRDTATLFRGTCYRNEAFTGRWVFDLQTNEAFRYLGLDGKSPPQAFARCADTSRLAENAGLTACTGDCGRTGDAAPILDSPDLFNLFESLVAGRCAGMASCGIDGVDGSYSLQAITRRDVEIYAAITRLLMVYEQGVSVGVPIPANEVAFSEGDPTYLIRRDGCAGQDCATAVMAVFGNQIGAAPGSSGYMGFAFEMPTGWRPAIWQEGSTP